MAQSNFLKQLNNLGVELRKKTKQQNYLRKILNRANSKKVSQQQQTKEEQKLFFKNCIDFSLLFKKWEPIIYRRNIENPLNIPPWNE